MGIRRWLGVSVIVLGLSAWGAAATAQEAEEEAREEGSAGASAEGGEASEETEEEGTSKFQRHILYYQSGTFMRWNPIGLGNLSQMGYRYHFYDSENPLLKGSYAMAGLTGGFNPAFSRLGPMLEVSPLAVLRLTASYERMYTFGTFGILQSFRSPADAHSDTVRGEGEDAEEAYRTWASMLTLGVLLQAKVGPIAARVNYRAVHTQADLKGEDTVYWDSFFDQLMPDGGWMMTTDSDLLYTDGGLAAGIRHTWMGVDYPDGLYRPEESKVDRNNYQRIGPLFAYTFSKNPGDKFDEPQIFVLVHWYLRHRHRTGDDRSAFEPMAIVGFAFKGVLFP